MIEEVKEFMDSFFQAELKARTLDIKPDLQQAEQAIKALYAFCTDNCYNRLGVVLPVKVQSDSDYENWHDIEFTIPRHLFKISRYKNVKYGEVYLVYVSSILNERTQKIFRMTECFIVAPIEGNYKVIGGALSDPDDRTKWDYSFRDPEFNFNSPGEFLGVERYVEPIHDKDKLEKFKRDE